MMKTSQTSPEYYPIPNERFHRSRGYTTNRSKHGHYNVTERDYGDQKVSYFIPASYERNYDVSQLDGARTDDEQERYHTPVLIRRRYYRQYDDHDEYHKEEYPPKPIHRHFRTPPMQPRVIKRIYVQPSPTPPPQTIEYIYEDDYKPETEQIIEYVMPKQRHIEQPQVYRKPPSPLPRHFIPPPVIRQSPHRILPPITNRSRHLTLQEVLAENRARRGSRIPIPRREIDEEKIYDPPIYRKNYVKNGFIVHK